MGSKKLELYIDGTRDKASVSNDTCMWNEYGSNANEFSLVGYIEDNAQRLRKKYLAFIYDLGKYKINGT